MNHHGQYTNNLLWFIRYKAVISKSSLIFFHLLVLARKPNLEEKKIHLFKQILS